MDRNVLTAVLALTRAGASERAWSVFVAAGGSMSEDPAALTVRGRLLKDKAAGRLGPERQSLYRDAAAVYAAAAAASGATYPLINAATLYLLAGEPAQAMSFASDVLATLDANPEEPETPYWR